MREIRTSADKIVRRGDRIHDVELEDGPLPVSLVPPTPLPVRSTQR